MKVASCTAVLLLASSLTLVADDPAYRASIEKWRSDRESLLKSDTGWLTVAGLHWMNEGDNTVGSDPTNDIVLPEGASPKVGVLQFRNGKTTLRVAPGANVTIGGKQVTGSVEVKPDLPGPATLVITNNITMLVHASGARLGIRVRDTNSKLRREFKGSSWFPIDESHRVTGRWVRYAAPKKVNLPNSLGDTEVYTAAGDVVVKIQGQEFRMQPMIAGSGDRRQLWFIIRDMSSGNETYPAARFLLAEMPDPNGNVVLDFNKAFNPPCAFNPHTTCPLPPPQNRLRVKILAGEMNYEGSKGT